MKSPRSRCRLSWCARTRGPASFSRPEVPCSDRCDAVGEGKKRFMEEATAFDMMLGIMVDSIVSRPSPATPRWVPPWLPPGTLVALHSVLTAVACRWHGLGEMIKGRAPTRYCPSDDRDESARRSADLTNRDLEDDLRRHGMTSSSYPS